MNITTYNNYPKDLAKIKALLIESISSCEGIGELASAIQFNFNYIEAVAYSESVRYEKVTDEVMKKYFENKTEGRDK